jgi:lipopolysaccharide/colanic/teichoic acid biosynthesis glycosyltransferase
MSSIDPNHLEYLESQFTTTTPTTFTFSQINSLWTADHFRLGSIHFYAQKEPEQYIPLALEALGHASPTAPVPEPAPAPAPNGASAASHAAAQPKLPHFTGLAEGLIRPKSRLGPLFGLTANDIKSAEVRLLQRRPMTRGQEILKRTFDIVYSGTTLLVISPLMLAFAIAIRLDSPGGAMYQQERIGRAGQPFRMLKFRTMRIDADTQMNALLAALSDGAGVSGPLFKMRLDPRVTRLGRFMRRYSLDELPQFWNILVGDMSVVGPRPPLAREQQTSPLLSLPGLTGLWVLEDNSLTRSEVLALEERYARNWSLRLDLKVIWRTFRAASRLNKTY